MGAAVLSTYEYLQRYNILRTRDIDRFRAEFAAHLPEYRLCPAGVDNDFEAHISVAAIGPISLVYAHHRGGELTAAPAGQVPCYDVHLSRSGHAELASVEDRVVVGHDRAAVLSPTMRAAIRLSSECRQLHVRIERFALERQLEALLGHPVDGPVRFDPAMDLRAAVSWRSFVDTLVRDLDTAGSLATHPLAIANVTQLLTTGLLLAQRHDYSRFLGGAGTRRSPRTLRRAVDYIEQHLDQPIGLSEIATAAGVGGRSLQRHFHECLGLSPMAYLQHRRLTRTHEQLRDACPGAGVTVTSTALSWGFTHVPRFAAAYRARYGVSPSTTLRRGATAPTEVFSRTWAPIPATR